MVLVKQVARQINTSSRLITRKKTGKKMECHQRVSSYAITVTLFDTEILLLYEDLREELYYKSNSI